MSWGRRTPALSVNVLTEISEMFVRTGGRKIYFEIALDRPAPQFMVRAHYLKGLMQTGQMKIVADDNLIIDEE